MTGIVLSIALIGVLISAFVMWVWGGFRFSPEAAMEAVSLGSSQRQHIKAENCYFYYETFDECYYEAENYSDWICDVTLVRKDAVGAIGMWYAEPNPRGYTVYEKETNESAGFLLSVEEGGKYHNFFIPSVISSDPLAFPDFLSEGYNAITVGGAKTELFCHSYFVTETKLGEFEINDTVLIVSG